MANPTAEQRLGRILFRLRLLFLLGIVLVLAGVIWSVWTAWFIAHTAEAPGQVVRVEQRGEKPGWYLTFSFRDAAEKPHTVETRYFVANGSCPPISSGDEIEFFTIPQHRSMQKWIRSAHCG